MAERKNKMALQNSIAKPTNTKAAGVTEYEANGEIVRISPNMIRKYLVNGGGNVTDEEVTMFLSLCRFQHLNPFIREAYLIKYGDTQPATIVVGKDVFIKRAMRQPNFDGFQAGIIVRVNETGEIKEREGTFLDRNTETLVGGWAKAFIKNFHLPFYSSVALSEYIGRKKNGEVNGQWSGKPATMIRKVALAQVLREAFPEQNSGGMYEQEELPEAQDVVLDDTAVIVEDVPQVKQDEQVAEVKVEVMGTAEDVLFE